MIPPCPRCGATKTDPVPHDFKYNLARALGYRRQRCSRCRKTRYLRRHDKSTSGSTPHEKQPTSVSPLAGETGTIEKAQPGPELESGPVAATESSNRDKYHCPACGSEKYHRTERTAKERMLRHPPMARCENCGLRFPHPGHPETHPEPLKSVEAAVTGSHIAEENKVPKMTQENSKSEIPKPTPLAQLAEEEVPKCPSCGSTKYHRTERTTTERVLRRPPMARCEKCGKRFPYVRQPEERKDSRTTSEANQSKDEKGKSADSSSDQDSTRCPHCGSTHYRRSRRTPLERLLFRPKMARCSHCRKRFPFPGS